MLTPALRSFSQAHPDGEVALREMTPGEQVKALLAGRIDLALLGNPCPEVEREFSVTVLTRIPLLKDCGYDYSKVVHGEQRLTLHRPLPPQADLIANARVVAAYDKGAQGPYAQRSPIERAVIAFISPNLFRLEREFAAKNDFQMAFHEFDWRLNDLTGRSD